MTTTTDDTRETLHRALEHQYRTYTSRLARLTLRGECRDGAARAALIAWARRGVADAADALRRMSDGTYGVCERCGGAIPLRCLTARPETRRCGPCGHHPG